MDDHFNAWFGRFRDSAAEFYGKFAALRSATSPAHQFEMLVELKTRNEEMHSTLHAGILKEVSSQALSRVQVSTLLNVNRELYLSNQSLLASVADALLDPQRSEDFESLPVGS